MNQQQFSARGLQGLGRSLHAAQLVDDVLELVLSRVSLHQAKDAEYLVLGDCGSLEPRRQEGSLQGKIPGRDFLAMVGSRGDRHRPSQFRVAVHVTHQLRLKVAGEPWLVKRQDLAPTR